MFKDRIHYPGRLVADVMSTIARCGVTLILYSYIFKNRNNDINGITFQVAAWSMFLYFAFMNLRLRYLATTIMDNVKSGTVENLFAKPVNYLMYRIWWQIGQGLYSFLIVLIFGSVALWFFVGIPDTMSSAFFIVTLAIVFLLSILLSIGIYAAVGLLAFWIEDIKPLFWIIDKSVMILGGSYLPVALFPTLIYSIAVWSPFGASQFITHTVYESWKTNYLEMLGIQAAWIIIFFILVAIMFKKAHKRVSVNGG